MKINKLFYIGERRNPQLPKPYYQEFGQLSKTEVKKKENCIYGSMTLKAFESENEMNLEIEKLKTAGFRVCK